MSSLKNPRLQSGSINFQVFGIPRPQGSMVRSTKGLRHANNMLDKWRKAVGWSAALAMKEQGFTLAGKDVHFKLELVFQFEDVRALRTGRNDLDKLCRAVFDSLAGVLFPDDSGVFQLTARKELVDCDPGVKVRATEIDDLPSGRLIPITSLADEEYPF